MLKHKIFVSITNHESPITSRLRRNLEVYESTGYSVIPHEGIRTAIGLGKLPFLLDLVLLSGMAKALSMEINRKYVQTGCGF